MRKCIFILLTVVALFMLTCRIEARDVIIGDLQIEVPDPVAEINTKDFMYCASDNDNLTMIISAVDYNNRDIKKIREKAEFKNFPFLKDATLINTESVPWHDWSKDYVKRTYRYNKKGKEWTAYTYQTSVKDYALIILMLPYTDKGDSMAEDILSKGLKNNSWFMVSGGGWFLLFICMVLSSCFVFMEDDMFTLKNYILYVIISMIVFSIISLIFVRGNMNLFWTPFLIALAIVIICPPFRKPIVRILENLTDSI